MKFESDYRNFKTMNIPFLSLTDVTTLHGAEHDVVINDECIMNNHIYQSIKL